MKSSSGPSRTSTTASEAYGAFAYAYDRALGARFFKSVRKLLDETLAKYPTPRKTHLDVACGTGLVLNHFRKKGWMSTGVDASFDMLTRASGRVVAADMRALPFRGTFGRITCLYDSLNHLIEREELVAAFRSMRSVMGPDSLLLFDMNHPDIYPEVWGIAEPFVSNDADYHLSIATTYRKREKIGKAMVTGWAMVDGKKVAIREQHRQRAYSEREIVSALAEAQLTPVEVLDFDPYGEEIEARTVKLFFVVAP
ncbi:MAG TPA: class I SAM-dependent methyltransferase [Thermoanaerobaculia bacterium]|nr:class I SAM-dependent methyltransferase [Thermoanaerobaculia bacterium]